MAVETPDGYLIVRPNYRTPAKPKFLSVTIGFPPAQAQYLTEEMLGSGEPINKTIGARICDDG